MLLTRSPGIFPHGRRAVTLFLLSLLTAAPYWCAGCSAPVRYDDSHSRRKPGAFGKIADRSKAEPPSGGRSTEVRRYNANEPDDVPAEFNSRFNFVEYSPAEKPTILSAMFNFRLDDGVAQQREERASRLPPRDPRTQPSFREQREARAAEYAEADMRARGGNIFVKHDGSSSNPNQVKFAAAPGALGLCIDASPGLNAVDNIPNAMVVLVYHLSDRGELDQLSQSEAGMRRLLEGKLFDASAKSVREMTIQPGQTMQLALDRAEDGRYVAIVAGYNRPDARTSLCVIPYGVGEYKKKGETSFHRAVNMYAPLPMNLRVSLGEKDMQVSETDRIYRNLQSSTRLQRQQPYHFEMRDWW